MISPNRAAVKRLNKRWPDIEKQFDEDVATFMLTVMDKGNPDWMWKKYEIYKAGGKAAFHGFMRLMAMDLATHWRIDNVYVIAQELYILDIEAIALKAFHYEIRPGRCDGFWLYHGFSQVQHYRREGNARRRALLEIKKEIKNRF